MLSGFNHNIRYRDRIFHVQTEDHGLKQATVVTQVFLGGQIVHLERTSYRDALNSGGEGCPDAIRVHMQEQHKDQLRRLVSGEFDARIGRFLQNNPTPETSEPPLAALDAPTLSVDPTHEEPSAFLEALDQEMARQQPLAPTLPSVSRLPEQLSPAFPKSVPLGSKPSVKLPPRPGRPVPADTLIDFGIPGSLREVLRARLKAPERGVSGPLPAGVAHPQSTPSIEVTSPPRPDGTAPWPDTAGNSNPSPPAGAVPPAPRSRSRVGSAVRRGSAVRSVPQAVDARETMLELDAGALKREIEAQREQLRAIQRALPESDEIPRPDPLADDDGGSGRDGRS